MGFLHAVRALANRANGEKKDNVSFLELPVDAEKGRVIRVGLKVSSLTLPYQILELGSIDAVDVMGGEDTEDVWKTRYLFRDPSSPSSGWRYSPVLKLGTPTSAEKFEQSWEKFRKALGEKTFPDFEVKQVLAKGSTQKIMDALENRKAEIYERMEKKRPHALVFGIEFEGRFYYPGELDAFTGYCTEKLSKLMATGSLDLTSGKTLPCSVCAKPLDSSTHLDKIFPFATFDKPGFIPALDRKNIDGIFPICAECFDQFSQGRALLESVYSDSRTIQGYTMWILPEVINSTEPPRKILKSFENYIQEKKTSSEASMLRYVATANQSLIFHFIIWEKIQAKELVHTMIEDVSPSWLFTIETSWKNTRKRFFPEEAAEDKDGLDYAFNFIYYLLTGLNPKNNDDKGVLAGNAIEIISRMLNREKIDTLWLKTLFVSRFPALFASKDKFDPRFSLKKQMLLIEWVESIHQNIENKLEVIGT